MLVEADIFSSLRTLVFKKDAFLKEGEAFL